MKQTANEGEQVLIYSPRTTYRKIQEKLQSILVDLTLNFDKSAVGKVLQQLDLSNKEATRQQFILKACEYLQKWKIDARLREAYLIWCLNRIFSEIDLYDSGRIKWQDFASYVIDRAIALKNIKQSEESNSFVMSPIRPNKKFQNQLCKPIWIPGLDRLAFFQQEKDCVYFMNIETGQLNDKCLQVKPVKFSIETTVHKKKKDRTEVLKKEFVISTKTRILDMLYIEEPKYALLVTSSTDGYVRGWKHNQGLFSLANQPDNEEEPFRRQFPKTEVFSLAWDYLNEILYCGLKDGGIRMWNLKTDTQKALAVSAEKKKKVEHKETLGEGEPGVQLGHNGMVMEMISMPKLQFVASAGIDGKLILWETINNRKKHEYTEHTKGILTLTFNESIIMLFSGGFDHKICIWNPYISSLIHKVECHSSAILCIRFIPGTNRFVSLDETGTAKIIDTRRFNVVSSFSIQAPDEKHRFDPSSFTCVGSPLKLVFSGSSIRIFDFDKKYKPQLTDDNTVIACRYHLQSLSFYTAAGSRIKVWSALTGENTHVYNNLTTSDITCFDFDSQGSRILVGDFKGKCYAFSVVDCIKLRNLAQHSGQVISIAHVRIGASGYIITAGADNTVHIINDSRKNEPVTVRSITIYNDVEITSISLLQPNKNIIVGTNVGVLGFYQIQTGKLTGNTEQLENNSDVISINVLRDLPFAFVCYGNGLIALLSLPPIPYRFRFVFTFIHFDDANFQNSLAIFCSVFLGGSSMLVVADQKNCLRAYNLKFIVDQLKKQCSRQGLFKSQAEERVVEMVSIKQNAVPVFWNVKAHSQQIVFIQSFNKEQYVLTCSFDKKVKIWASATGMQVCNIQQNFDPQAIRPIASLSTNSPALISKKERVSKSEKEAIASEIDPFYYQDLVKGQERISNAKWNLQVNLVEHFHSVMQNIVTSQAPLRQRLREYSIQQKRSSQSKQLTIRIKQANQQNKIASRVVIDHPFARETRFPRLEQDESKMTEVEEEESKILRSQSEIRLNRELNSKLRWNKKKYGFQPIGLTLQNGKGRLTFDDQRRQIQRLSVIGGQKTAKLQLLKRSSVQGLRLKQNNQLADALRKLSDFDKKYEKSLQSSSYVQKRLLNL